MVRKIELFHGFKPFLAAVLFLLAGFAFTQEPVRDSPSVFSYRFGYGISLYNQARWHEAIDELRGAQEIAENTRQWSEAIYWVILARLAASDYNAALLDMEELERKAPNSSRSDDILYHRARAYFYLGKNEEALVLFKQYYDKSPESADARKAAAMYWMGECLFSMGQLNSAEEIFTWIAETYPGNSQFETVPFRIDMIRQKKVEIELLELIKYSHEESLKTAEEYQRRERTYEQALNAYQRRVAELLMDSRVADLETLNAEYRRKLTEADERIRVLEERLGMNNLSQSESSDEDLRMRALQLRNEIQWELNTLEAENRGSR